MRGVRLFSNGLSLSGEWAVRVSLGTSDPQEPQKPVNFSVPFVNIDTLPVSDPRWTLSLWEDEGHTPAGVESPKS